MEFFFINFELGFEPELLETMLLLDALDLTEPRMLLWVCMINIDNVPRDFLPGGRCKPLVAVAGLPVATGSVQRILEASNNQESHFPVSMVLPYNYIRFYCKNETIDSMVKRRNRVYSQNI